ncbi:putative mitochondrial inner membrane protein [Daedalea quercina L-15889]|uniref:Succinate dehydrogenase [ubiquinone] cytochrome b small subunit n=1 Tax=Daedalea quercina L-15889 TaxID=1314783 RepID=A0A165LPN6_9APHY|nr:putative mitochondrial inner membrane protein [Daedalea quercina L-15889]
MASALATRSALNARLASTFARRSLRPLAVHARSVSDAAYVPGGPIYRGTVNDPTTFPPPSKTHGSYHWAFERLLSAGLVPLTVAAFATSSSSYPLLDGILGVSLVMHSHIGFDSVVVDYLHPRKFPILGPVMTWTLRAATVGVLVGVYQFNTNDIGLTELIAKVWHA